MMYLTNQTIFLPNQKLRYMMKIKMGHNNLDIRWVVVTHQINSRESLNPEAHNLRILTKQVRVVRLLSNFNEKFKKET